MVEKVTIEITGGGAVVRLLDGEGKELNRAVHTPTDMGSSTSYAKGTFEDMDEDVLTTPLWEALDNNFFVHDVLRALSNQ
ncbi:hypothetical protein BSP36_193 [Bacillus phage BSP36]|uniref:Uncharacterized protein n=1 Tax=Bacillus phage BSP38 TaxID=2283013 RepID=A0A345MK55_BPBSP|nr:hypothetical protein HWB82_gp123 [Bacillus phage BSP38]AXH71237.1 hypothetical protein BSP38_195 [Bacillus phage BSP38]AYJ75280.1 hypothetical protein BSP36_193 [Bacillus phage BSP36]